MWWYRHWHAYFLERALSADLRRSPRALVYAQCPVSADVALRVRTTQPVVMAAHFNVSQADEWADKGEIPRSGTLFRSIRALEERVLGELDGIVYVSAFTKTILEERIPALREVAGIVVPNPVAVVPGSPARADHGADHGADHRADLITVGALEPRKNQRYLLDVLAAASRRGHRYTLTVVGDGPDRGRLEARTRELGLTSQVRFLGYQPDPRRLMPAHHLYCHTSTMESFGIVLVEAMAEGLPVLAAGVGGVPEVVRPGQDGLLWPLDDAEEAAGLLTGLMEDPSRRAEMAVTAKARATAEFSTEVVGRRLLDFLDTIAAQYDAAGRETV